MRPSLNIYSWNSFKKMTDFKQGHGDNIESEPLSPCLNDTVNIKKNKKIECKMKNFRICRNCHKTGIANLYQKGKCKECLIESFRNLRKLINNSHALESLQCK